MKDNKFCKIYDFSHVQVDNSNSPQGSMSVIDPVKLDEHIKVIYDNLNDLMSQIDAARIYINYLNLHISFLSDVLVSKNIIDKKELSDKFAEFMKSVGVKFINIPEEKDDLADLSLDEIEKMINGKDDKK